MMYLLDTNACITYLKVPHSLIRVQLEAQKPSEIAVCSVVKAELYRGAVRSYNPARTLAVQATFLSRFVSLPLDDITGQMAGRIRADLETLGLPIGPYDVLIAAIALVHNLILVTHNTAEFSRVPGLRLEDWQTQS